MKVRMNEMTSKEISQIILNQYVARTSKKRPFIVAIDGLSGSGKTTLVHQIGNELRDNDCKVFIIHIDDHIVERSRRYDTGFDEWYEYYFLQWDIEKLSTQFFQKLHNNSKEVSLPFYDQSTDSLTTRQLSFTNNTVILIEGIFLQRKEWKSFYDYILFLKCPREVRCERVLKRDMYIGDLEKRQNKYKRRYWPGEDYYLQAVKPIVHADIVIDRNE
ncbi:kinase [Cytobacillus sp.]|uniref:kinase n=1 Tax=Cytobacillus sp. TaxID=2675269 RepID=UPI0028BE7AB8|nr:kinase [Cytobacillus sp.]